MYRLQRNLIDDPELEADQAKIDAIIDTRAARLLVDGSVRLRGRKYVSHKTMNGAVRQMAARAAKPMYAKRGFTLYRSQSDACWKLTSRESLDFGGTAGIAGQHAVVADISFFLDLAQGLRSIRAMIERLKTQPGDVTLIT